MHDERGPESRAAAEYLNGRWQEQSDYFETKSRHNQRLFIRMRDIMLLCSWFTPITIFLRVVAVFQSSSMERRPTFAIDCRGRDISVGRGPQLRSSVGQV